MVLAYDPKRANQLPRPYQTELSNALVTAVTPVTPGDKWFVEVATGGGKSRILNDFLAEVVFARQLTAIVVAKDWTLTFQMADDLVARNAGALDRISYVGDGEANSLFESAATGAGGSIVYTTIQTWHARRDAAFLGKTFDIVVADESHWGEHGKHCRALFDRYSNAAAFVGLTATPRVQTDFRRVGTAYPLKTLVEQGFLARPVPVIIETGIDWAPGRSIGHGDFLPSSLAQLGMLPARNELIVQTYLANRDKYGQTLVFACSVAHAEQLARALSAQGVTATFVHCRLPKGEAHRRIRAFAESEFKVLTNFAMLTHGVDIPAIKTVFTARPTTSDILFSQMIGRGSRKIEGKDEFYVVDFQDNIQTHGIDVIRADGFLGSRVSAARQRGPRLAAHAFEPGSLIVLGSEPGYEVLEGLEIQPNQTFGVELEAAQARGRQSTFLSVAQSVITALQAIVPTAPSPMPTAHMFDKDNTVWNVEPDPSCGFEVTSRILVGIEGFREFVDACRALDASFERAGLTSNTPRAGVHLHLGASLDREALTNLLAIAAYYEPAIMSLVAPSRAKTPYVKSARRPLKAIVVAEAAVDVRDFAGRGWKYCGVNPSPLATSYGTVEIRYHSATIDPAKILPWISLWMRIFDAAVRGGRPDHPLKRVRSRPLCAGPRGDIAELCRFVGAGAALTARLVQRRNQIVSNSWCRHSLFGERAKRLLETWLQHEPNDAVREAAE